jgi:hypothetical protein
VHSLAEVAQGRVCDAEGHSDDEGGETAPEPRRDRAEGVKDVSAEGAAGDLGDEERAPPERVVGVIHGMPVDRAAREPSTSTWSGERGG